MMNYVPACRYLHHISASVIACWRDISYAEWQSAVLTDAECSSGSMSVCLLISQCHLLVLVNFHSTVAFASMLAGPAALLLVFCLECPSLAP